MKLNPFRIEQYYDRYEFVTQYMLSSSDAESRSIRDLLSLEANASEAFLEHWCGYTESRGAPYLRQEIIKQHKPNMFSINNALVFSAAEEAIFVAYHSLLSAGDHVIVESPCYESAIEVARSTGASVSLWQRHYEDAWEHDLTALKKLIQPNTKLIYINSPHNPTGTEISRSNLDAIVAVARDAAAWLFSDEVYRNLEHNPSTRLPIAAELYERAFSLGSMSKSYGLPGLRLGWLVCQNQDALTTMRNLKDYTSICASAPSEFLTALALRHTEKIIGRNLSTIQKNVLLLDGFMARNSNIFSWVRPTASAIGFPHMAVKNVTTFCETLAQECSVLLLPGTVYDQPQHVRVGFGRANMNEALEVFETWLQKTN